MPDHSQNTLRNTVSICSADIPAGVDLSPLEDNSFTSCADSIGEVTVVSRTSDRLELEFFFSSRRRHTISTRDWSSDVCSSDLRAGRFAADHPADALDGIVALDDRTPAELRYLYARCRAYVSFDHNRGFGWSLADALQYGTPTLSRGLGVMSIPGVDHTGCLQYETNDELLACLHRGDFTRTVRDLGDLSPARFVERFEALVRVLRVVRSSRSRS